jgi:hypothetical protein
VNYKQLTAIHVKYKDQGLAILGFVSNTHSLLFRTPTPPRHVLMHSFNVFPVFVCSMIPLAVQSIRYVVCVCASDTCCAAPCATYSLMFDGYVVMNEQVRKSRVRTHKSKHSLRNTVCSGICLKRLKLMDRRHTRYFVI